MYTKFQLYVGHEDGWVYINETATNIEVVRLSLDAAENLAIELAYEAEHGRKDAAD